MLLPVDIEYCSEESSIATIKVFWEFRGDRPCLATIEQNRLHSSSKKLLFEPLGCVDFQLLFSLLHALHAAALRNFTSFSELSIRAPRYLKSVTFSSLVPSFVWMLIFPLWLNDIYLVLLAFIRSPTFPTDESTLLSSFCACWISSDNKAMSSAKSKSVMTSGPTRLLFLFSRWNPRFNHFENLLGSPPDIDDEEEEITPVLEELDQEEYEKAKKLLVEGKSCGRRWYTTWGLKRCDMDAIILSFCNNALVNGEKPSQWSVLNIVPIPKSGDLSLSGYYRGISLSSFVAKTYNRLILNRIRPVLDSRLRTNQNGFRVGRTTVGHILAMRRLIEGIKANQLPAIITFIDFRKAFDTIHRGKMLKIMRAYGIPEQLVNAIGQMYENTRAKVISPDGETDLFKSLAGVLQGDTLAPYLFVIVLDYALRTAIDGREEDLGSHLEALIWHYLNNT